MTDKIKNALNLFVEELKYKGDKSQLDDYEEISFTPPFFQSGILHPETICKFDKIHSIHLNKGYYGPFYRYSPDESNLKANNELGGYFTDEIIICIGCAKKKLWLYDKNKEYFYNFKKDTLYRHKCFIIINDDSNAVIFIGNVAFGDAFQIRPNNWILDEKLTKNKIIYKSDGKLTNTTCEYCKDFIKTFEKNK